MNGQLMPSLIVVHGRLERPFNFLYNLVEIVSQRKCNSFPHLDLVRGAVRENDGDSEGKQRPETNSSNLNEKGVCISGLARALAVLKQVRELLPTDEDITQRRQWSHEKR